MAAAAVYDVIVVGAGDAAICAAISATEQGAKVLMLEKGAVFGRLAGQSAGMHPKNSR